MLASFRDPVRRFRIAAIAEAVSWCGLLAGMLLKYGPSENEIGVQVFGPIHGVLFLVYIAVAYVTWPAVRWPTRVGLIALLASIPPLGTVVFERWAARGGHLRVVPATA